MAIGHEYDEDDNMVDAQTPPMSTKITLSPLFSFFFFGAGMTPF